MKSYDKKIKLATMQIIDWFVSSFRYCNIHIIPGIFQLYCTDILTLGLLENTSKDVKSDWELFFKQIYVKRVGIKNFLNLTISLLLLSLTINTRSSKLKSYEKTNQFGITHITQTVTEHNRI